MSQHALVATLNNGKKILVEPKIQDMKCGYRYLSDKEISDNTLNFNRKYIWHEAPIHRTFEKGKTIIFCTVEATPIVLARI